MDDYSFPSLNDNLFISDKNYYNACLNFAYDKRHLYAVGYKSAADILIEHIFNNQINQDVLIYPIVFLYRHYLELHLKKLINDGNKFLELPEKNWNHHKINELWQECKKIITQIFPNEINENINALELLINEFAQKDPISTSFRYPVDTKGNNPISDIKIINIKNLHEIMAKIDNLLCAISDNLEADQDYQNELKSYI